MIVPSLFDELLWGFVTFAGDETRIMRLGSEQRSCLGDHWEITYVMSLQGLRKDVCSLSFSHSFSVI